MMPKLVPMGTHDQKCHAAPHLNHLDLRNTLVPLMMQLASQDSDTGANLVT